jgi:predicted nucleotidyltransferase
MISEQDSTIIREISKKYKAKRVLLFGSSLSPSRESRDIDLAVEGVSGKDYYSFYGELLCALSKPVDVIDLSITSKFVQLVQNEGIPLYG